MVITEPMLAIIFPVGGFIVFLIAMVLFPNKTDA